MKRKKTALIYDKWLEQLGGGEVVAATMASILAKEGYEVTFVSGKKAEPAIIHRRLGINLSTVKFAQIWNDELKLSRLAKGKDIFINLTFMDYSRGGARRNIYYTLFPTRLPRLPHNKFYYAVLLPWLANYFIPVEQTGETEEAVLTSDYVAYPFDKSREYSFYFLIPGKAYKLVFTILLTAFYSSRLKDFIYTVTGGEIIDKNISVAHKENLIKYRLTVVPASATMYFNLKDSHSYGKHQKSSAYLFSQPHLYSLFSTKGALSFIRERITRRLRAGLFLDQNSKINSYNRILADSKFTGTWIEKYWGKHSQVIYPPVNLLFQKKKIDFDRKKNYIVSIGRFFTLGHGKKQEIMIVAFKKLYAQGYKNWQLHLVGGVGKDTESTDFVQKLKNLASGLPVYFHTNASRAHIEKLLQNSKIYWHATGFGENEKRSPIKMEHFGIAPVEAISAGLIPILYSGGGLPEIIDAAGLDKGMHLFATIEELVEKTIFHIEKRPLIDWDKVYGKLDENFSYKMFRKNFLKVVNDL